MEQQSVRRPSWSFLTLLRSGLTLIGLLMINSFLVKTFVDTSAVFADDLRISQTLQFILPLVLIFIEYWIYDFFRRIAAANRD